MITIASGDFKGGAPILLTLLLLSEDDMYGYQISQLMLERSYGDYVIPEGSLYPVLYKLEEKGYVSGVKKLVGKRMMRVYYHLEPSGKAYLEGLMQEHLRERRGIDQIIKNSAGGEMYDIKDITRS